MSTASASDPEGLYVRVGDPAGTSSTTFVGTEATESTWDPKVSAGGAVLALFGHVLEDVPTLVPMGLARMTADLFRPVPIGRPLELATTVVREGKKLQVVDFVLMADGVEQARARALRLREQDLREVPALPSSTTTVDPAVALLGPDDPRTVRIEGRPGVPRFLELGAQLRRAPRVDGGAYGLWMRLRVPVIAGEPVRPTSKLAMAMDFANLIGADLDPRRVTAINPDVSAHVTREPVGEWIGMIGETRFAHGTGRGFSMATISDEDGVVGVASTSQIVQPLG